MKKEEKEQILEQTEETEETVTETAEETEQTEETQDSEDKAHDEEFMDDIKEEPLTAEKYQKKKESLLAVMDNCKKILEDDEDLYSAASSGVLKILKGKLKDTLKSNLEEDYEDIKELKDGIKDLEALNITTKILSNSLNSYNLAKSDLKRYERELEDLENQARQMTLFDTAENNEETEEKELETV